MIDSEHADDVAADHYARCDAIAARCGLAPDDPAVEDAALRLLDARDALCTAIARERGLDADDPAVAAEARRLVGAYVAWFGRGKVSASVAAKAERYALNVIKLNKVRAR